MTSEAERQRRARLSSALRENLKRRKAQARARVEPDALPAESGEAPPEPHNPVRDKPTIDDEPGG